MNNKTPKNQLLRASLGNTIEWFDYGLFIFLAPLIGEKFFPVENATNATLLALVVFACGFICRPLGGIFFGHAGDTRGRASTLRMSILLISVPTLLIGLLPGYATIGLAAPILFTILRMVQGLSIGGEYSGIMIYLAESSPAKNRGFFTSFAAWGANLGFLSATLVYMGLNIVLSNEQISLWAWRIPFILAGLLGSLLFIYRFNLAETPTFTRLRSAHKLEKQPLLAALKSSYRPLVKIFGLTSVSSTLYYMFFAYIPNQVGLNAMDFGHPKLPLIIQSLSLFAMLFMVPFAAACGDRFGRKRMLMLTSLGTLLFAMPAFTLLYSPSLSGVLAVFFFATFLSSFDQGNSLCAVVENCPPSIRYSGIAFSYNLGNAIFGGTAPLIATLLGDKFGPNALAFYLMLTAIVSFFAASSLLGHKEEATFLSIEKL